ncbi:hypothetical protein, partial [Eubacterium sp.]
AVLLCAVKGGVRHQKTKKSAIIKVLLSLFLLTHFFIGHLTLSNYKKQLKQLFPALAAFIVPISI